MNSHDDIIMTKHISYCDLIRGEILNGIAFKPSNNFKSALTFNSKFLVTKKFAGALTLWKKCSIVDAKVGTNSVRYAEGNNIYYTTV